MEHKVFYSWQSDLPNATNRGFIQTALEKAAKTIRNDNSIQVEPVIDRDTAGVPGAPDIVHTIFAKIDQASVFVCDVSIINKVGKRSKKRPTPNPNVLIELGYAIKTLGWNRIILVMNTVFGIAEQLPFDLKTKSAVVYSMLENQERADERRKLEGQLEAKLREIFTHLIKEETPAIQPIETEVMEAVLKSLPNRTVSTRRYMASLISELFSLAPDFSQERKSDELLVEQIEQTKELVTNFTSVIETMVAAKDSESIIAVSKSFDGILKHYHNPIGFSGYSRREDFDFYKFLGHELFVTILAFLIKNESWDLVTELLELEFYVENPPNGIPQTVSFGYISQRVELLEIRRKRLKVGGLSLHASILKERHSQGMLGNSLPFNPFMDADFFLFLRAEFSRNENTKRMDVWRPWSTAFLTDSYRPEFLVKAQSKRYAEKLLRPLGIESIEQFRTLLVARASMLERVFEDSFVYGFEPLYEFNPDSIGTKQSS